MDLKESWNPAAMLFIVWIVGSQAGKAQGPSWVSLWLIDQLSRLDGDSSEPSFMSS